MPSLLLRVASVVPHGSRSRSDGPVLYSPSPSQVVSWALHMEERMENDALVVVVDDDDGICRAVQRTLINAGYRARTFNTARGYLAEQEGMEPSCLIIDIKIPDLDGLTMLRESRAAGPET